MSHFAMMVDEDRPKANQDVLDGLACKIMEGAMEYVHRAFKFNNGLFPEGLVYESYSRCTTDEVYAVDTKLRQGCRSFSLAESSVFMVKYFFSFNGQPLPPRYIYLPYVTEAGILYMSGVKYHFSPVLSDKVLSIGKDSIFVRTLGDKKNFHRTHHSIVVNDVRENVRVIWAPIHSKGTSSSAAPTTRAQTCIVHYLFAKFGFTETFRKFAGFVPVTGTDEINEDSYPRESWIIIESASLRTGIKPRTVIEKAYTPTNIRLAIPLDRWDAVTQQLVSGFYYVVDHFPQRFDISYLDSTNLWMVLLGHIIHSGMYGDGKLYDKIKDHLDYLQHYIDPMTVEKFRESGHKVENFYELLVLLIKQFSDISIDNDKIVDSMYGKSLDLLPYVLDDLTMSLRNVVFKLSKLRANKKLTADDIVNVMNRTMTLKMVFNMKSKITTEVVSYCGDNKYPKLTSRLAEQQSRADGQRDSGHTSLSEDDHLNVSMIEAGSIGYLSKSNPRPQARINPFVNIDMATGTIIPNPQHMEVLTRTQNLLTAKKI